jgi:RNA polymerase sigma-70 factor (ECF subfamily)
VVTRHDDDDATGGAGDASLDDAVREGLAVARAAWPTLRLEDAAFAAHVRALAADPASVRKRAADLYLACACASGVAGAAQAFERAYRRTIEGAVARVNRDVVDEATQALLVELLVAEPGRTPRIANYAGRAALSSWLTTLAARQALHLRRRRADQPHDSISGVAVRAVGSEPELALARARHGRDLDQALKDALTTLDPRQRFVLRVRHIEGWRLEEVAETYRVSRATAARMEVAAREALLAETKRLLRERLTLTSSDLDSLVAILQSHVNVSLAGLLGEPAPKR